MSGAGEKMSQTSSERGLPLENIKRCRIGQICWFTNFEEGKPFRDIGVIVSKNVTDGLIVIQSFEKLNGRPEHFDKYSGQYIIVPGAQFDHPVLTNLDTLKKHIADMQTRGVAPRRKELLAPARKVFDRMVNS